MNLVLSIATGLVPALFGFMVYQNMKSPAHLGVRGGKLADMPKKPNAVSTQTDIKRLRVEPLPFKDSLEATRAAVLKVLDEMGRNAIQVEKPDYVYTVFSTPLMRYKDDVELYLDSQNAQVHFRSQSRVGYSDLGVNRKRYEAFRKAYQAI